MPDERLDGHLLQAVRLVHDDEAQRTGGRLLTAEGQERCRADRGPIEMVAVERRHTERALPFVNPLELARPVRAEEEIDTSRHAERTEDADDR